MSRIYLCYRAKDGLYAALLDEKLLKVFPPEDVFRAGRSIEYGAEYPQAIRTALDSCETLLVIVGPHWATSFREYTVQPDGMVSDWVRYELDTALRRQARIVPLLLEGASRLRETDLPQEISAVALRHSLPFTLRTMERDFAELLRVLRTDSTQSHQRGTEHALPATPLTVQRDGRRGEHYVASIEVCGNGLVEIDAFSRDSVGRLVSRLSGRVDPHEIGILSMLVGAFASETHSQAFGVGDPYRHSRN